MKSEPETYSIDDLKKDKKTLWDGIRNYQARNFMTQEMSPGDLVIFYHSNSTPPHAAGLMEVSQKAQADMTAQDPKSNYFDPKASPEKPIWECVEVKYIAHLKNPLSLDKMRTLKKLAKMRLLQRGNRLSIMPVSKGEFIEIVTQGGLDPKKFV